MIDPLWSAKQRWVVIAGLAAILTYLSINYWYNSVYTPWPVESDGSRASLIDRQINPNTASRAELEAVAYIGPALAQSIVEYRDRAAAEHPDKVIFQSPEDLLKVRGIGPATLDRIGPWLMFGPQEDD